MLTIAKILIEYGYNRAVRYIFKNNPNNQNELQLNAQSIRDLKMQEVDDYLSSIPAEERKEILRKDVKPLWNICGYPDLPYNGVKAKVRYFF